MGKETGIGWTQKTWNPFKGCRKVSLGCRNCYMFRDQERYGMNPEEVVRTKTVNDPLKWKEPSLIFTCSWSDWFIEEADQWRDELWGIIKQTPHHTYQILTKRPDRIANHLPSDWGQGYGNVWLGVSGENQDVLMERMGHLSKVKAVVKFLSAEPLLGSLDLLPIFRHQRPDMDARLDWVIVGGESGAASGKYIARDCKMEWISDIVGACKTYDVPVFVKQLGSVAAKNLSLFNKAGADMKEFPKHIQIQQFPKIYNKS